MRYLLFLLGLCAGFTSVGQNFLSWKYSDRYFSLSAGTGATTYFGDVTTTHPLNTGIDLVSLGLEVRLLNRFSARIEGAHYHLQGKDAWAREGSFAQQRNHGFASNNWEGNFQVIYYLKPYAGDYFRRWQWDPYIGAGVGLTTYYPYREVRGTRYYLRDLPTEENKEYKNTALVIPLTAGIKWKLNDFMNLNFEVGYRLAMTDYLDDVSGIYPDLSDESIILQDLSNPKDLIQTTNEEAYLLLVPGARRGNTSSMDAYLFTAIKVEFFLPPGIFQGKGK